METRWATFALIAAVTLGRLLYLAFACPFDLAPDEAHYWDWSRQLDWCYYSKGPLVAWLVRASCAVFGDTMLAVRLPAVLCGGLLLLGLRALMMQVHRSEKLALVAVALALTLPIVAAGSLLMTIDAPFVCAWMWALVFAYRAAIDEAKWAWPATGLCILVGVLAKHTMVLFVPSFALFLLTTPSMRVQLKRPGFWLMTSIGALGGLPILWWNALNDWVTLRHTQGHAGFDETAWHWLGPLKYLGGQFAVLLGFWFIAWSIVMWLQRPSREERPTMRFLWWMSLPTFVFFGLFAFRNGGGEPNWPIVAYLSGLVLAVEKLSTAQPSIRFGILTTASLGLLLTVALHEPLTLQPILMRLTSAPTVERPMPIRRVDPTVRLRGWRTLAADVDQVRAELRARGIEPVLACERWTQAAELAFYCDDRPSVHCFGVLLGDRHCQYDLWRPNPAADPTSFLTRTFVLVNIDATHLPGVFEHVEPARVIEYRENGVLVAQWTITIAHGFRDVGQGKGIESY